MYVIIILINSPINLDVWGPTSSVKEIYCRITYVGNLFIVVNICVEPATENNNAPEYY